jgi:hypothetical protein
VLQPVMKAFDSRQAQSRLDQFVTAERAAVIQSARIAKAVKSLRQGRALTADMAIHDAVAFAEDETNEAGSDPKCSRLSSPPKAAAKRKRAPKKKKREDGGAARPKRVKTAFFLFVDDFRVTHKESNPNAKQPEIASAAGARWRAMGEEEKAPYQEAHAELKAQQATAGQQQGAPQQGPEGGEGATARQPQAVSGEEEEDGDGDDDFVLAPREGSGSMEAAPAVAGKRKQRKQAPVSYGAAMDGTT